LAVKAREIIFVGKRRWETSVDYMVDLEATCNYSWDYPEIYQHDG
jgi:hypothetical protein